MRLLLPASNALGGQWICMYRDILHNNLLLGPAFPIYGDLLDFVQSLHAFNHPPKHCILAIQLRLGRKQNKELGAIGIGPFVSHANDSARIVSERWPDLILE
jgi:hypothetical protein